MQTIKNHILRLATLIQPRAKNATFRVNTSGIRWHLPLVVAASLVVSSLASADAIVSGSVQFGTTNYNADWYLPTTQPTTIIYLQHGFSRDKKNIKDVASSLMSKGFMVLAVNASMSGGNAGLAPNVSNAFINSTLVPPNNYQLPSKLVLAGHSAGGLHVSLVGKDMVAKNYAKLKGVVLFDPVDSNSQFASAANAIVNSGRKLYAVTANSSSCNSSNNTEAALKALNQSFVGIKLTSNSKHTDVEGTSTDFLGTLTCGKPQVYNTSYIKDAAAGWAKDIADGTTTATYYPGGAFIAGIISANRGALIK